MPVRRHGTNRPPTGSDERHDNLPTSLTSFVGRQADLEQVVTLLGTSRLLTLTGVGGCGKTRLAQEVARAVLDRYPHGVWLIELAPLKDPALVVQRIGAVLGVRETAEAPILDALTEKLRARELLLVVDNCEHLLQACAELFEVLLQSCALLRILATSRESVGIGGEVAWRVPSLAMPDASSSTSPDELALSPAVQLFLERASAVQPRFGLTSRNATAVAQICRRLDGIPLAIELAAARIGALTAEQIAERLDQRFRLLTGGSRTALPRQQTLSATLDWSYDLLGKSERRLFERLAVFAGGWTLEAAEAVCADRTLPSDDVLDSLTQLTRKSLVMGEESADGAERYSLLETVRDYAQQKLASRAVSEVTGLRERHAAYYEAQIEQLPAGFAAPQGSTREPGSPVVDQDHDNSLAMFAWCLESNQVARGWRLAWSYSPFWTAHGLYAEGRRWATALLHGAEQSERIGLGVDVLTPIESAQAHAMIGLYASRQGDYQEALVHEEAALAIARELGEPSSIVAGLAWIGMLEWMLGNTPRAVERLEAARALLDQSPTGEANVGFAALTFRNLGIAARSQGDYARAAAYFQASIEHAQRRPELAGYNVARGLCHLGRTAFLSGERERSRSVFGKALEIMRDTRLAGHTLADCLDWLAALAGADGRVREAAVLFGAAEAQWQASGAVRYAPERALYTSEVAAARAKIAVEEFEAAWTEGRAMSRERAVDYALRQTER